MSAFDLRTCSPSEKTVQNYEKKTQRQHGPNTDQHLADPSADYGRD
jgi:hypothetical protein